MKNKELIGAFLFVWLMVFTFSVFVVNMAFIPINTYKDVIKFILITLGISIIICACAEWDDKNKKGISGES